jgi:hypothetical protein
MCVATMLHCIDLKMLNADEPVQHEEKRLATWGTDVPQDLVLNEKKLQESLKKVSVFLSDLWCLSFIISPLFVDTEAWVFNLIL